MSNRELRALGVIQTNPITESTGTESTNNTVTMATAITATQVNPFHDVIDLSSAEGKKLYQKATQGLPDDQKYKGDPRDIISFIERIQSKSIDFGWNSITDNIGSESLNIFETPGKLTIQACKAHCDPFWADGSEEANQQFCIKSNMFYLFVKNSCTQNVIDELKEERQHWSRPGGGDGLTILIAVYGKNAHGTRASAVVAKSELLSMRTKDFQHNIQDVNKAFTMKEREIAFGGESNPDVLFQLFQVYESCPVAKFQEHIGELRRKYNRRDPSITKEHLMAEALSAYDTLVLEKKWFTQDPKTVAFASFVSKATSLLDKHGGKKDHNKGSRSKTKDKNKSNRKKTKRKEYEFKCVAPKDGEPHEKEVNGKTYYYCDKPHGSEGVPMWALHKPQDHKVFKKEKPQEEQVDIELQDDLRSLISVYAKDFS